MAQTLEDYVRRFHHLHTARNASQWPAATSNRAPHKPLLLLAVLDLIEEGAVAENRVELTLELAETFARYWACVRPGRERGKLVYPFFHLRYENFWHLVAQPGKEAIVEATRQVSSTRQLSDLVRYARMDDELFALLTVPESRQQLRDALVQAYFDPPTQARLVEQAMVNTQAFAYSRELLAGAGAARIQELPRGEAYFPAARDQGFRRAVVVAYDRRCALCGIRILTLDGHTAVDAAHIIPWSVSHDDRPTNGIALCRLCHWAFDEGMLAVTGQYAVLTSPQLNSSMNIAAHLGTLNGRGMIRPLEEPHWPDLHALAWHRQKVFRTQ